MSSPAAVLNRLAAASSPNTKRKRQPDDAGIMQGKPKRKVVEQEDAAEGYRNPSKRKSVSKLSQVTPKVKAATQISNSRRNKWEPTSPERPQEEATPASLVQVEQKKKVRRLKDKKLVQRNQIVETFSPRKHKKVTLTSYNTPVKVDRRKKQDLLAKFRKKDLQQSESEENVDSEGSDENADIGDREKAQDRVQDQREVSVLDLGAEEEEVEPQPVPAHTSTPEETSNGEEEVSDEGSVGEESYHEASYNLAGRTQISEEEIEKQGDGPRYSLKDANTKLMQSRPILDQNRQHGLGDVFDQEKSSEDEVSSGSKSPVKASERVKKQHRRPAMTEEEKIANNNLKVQRKKDNASETEAATKEEFDELGKKFIRGVDHAAEDFGGKTVWCKMGAAALQIKYLTGRQQPRESRIEAFLRTQKKLSRTLKELSTTNHDRMMRLLNELQERSSRAFLTRNGDRERGGEAIIDLFEMCISKTILLLKRALHYMDLKDLKCLNYLKVLISITLSLCNTALDWKPKPTTLETGIRSHVRNNIKASLHTISNALRDELQWRADSEKLIRSKQDLARKQAETRLALERRRQQLRQRLSRDSADIRTTRRQGDDDIIDIDDIEDEAMADVSSDRPWSEMENRSIIGGLQKYQGHDRFTRILAECPSLRSRTEAECVARARYYKKDFAIQLADDAAKGEHRFDWLASVK